MDLSWVNTVVLGAIAASLLLLWLVVALVRGRHVHPIIDENAFEAEAGYTSLDARYPRLMGQLGRAGTDLKPQGYIWVEGERLDAVSRGEFIEKDAAVRVVGTDAGFLVVAPAASLAEQAAPKQLPG